MSGVSGGSSPLGLRLGRVAPRIGIGYDSHRLEAGETLILGGVEIEHELGLAGHSDGDVLTHAVIDALLGAGGGGDLGELFPPDDEQWRGADSLDMLRVAIGTLAGAPLNVDATLICEQPQLSGFRAEMQQRLGEVISAPVSVKATTNEGMGAIGRGEGIACIAVALIDA